MTNTNKLRQALNEVKLVGELVEKNFEIKEFADKITGDKYNAATGSFSIRTGENEVHTARFFKKEFTKAGKLSTGFTGMQTAASRYLSVADIADLIDKGEAKEGDLKATKVDVKGNLSLNEFFNDNEEHKKYNQINIDFISEVKDVASYKPKAEYDLEAIVQSIKPEMSGDDETGRVKMSVLVPNYNGAVMPFDLVAPERGRDYIESNFQKGSSIKLYGNVVNFRKVTVKVEEMGFGENRETESYDYVVEYLISGATLIEEDNSKAFDISLVKDALVKREVHLEQLKTKSKQQQGSNNSANQNRGGFGDEAKTEQKKPNQITGVDLGSLF